MRTFRNFLLFVAAFAAVTFACATAEARDGTEEIRTVPAANDNPEGE